jgi:hypothetical protein
MTMKSVKNNFLVTTALTTSLLGYYKRAYADCTGSGGIYTCSSATTDTQNISAYSAAVSTVAGFNLDASAGNGIVVSGGALASFTDENASTIYANNGDGSRGLRITSGSYTYGDTTIVDIDGKVYSDDIAILAGVIYGYGDTLITTDVGSVVSAAEVGAESNSIGIYAFNYGYGSTALNINGTVYGNGSAIETYEYAYVSNLSITTGTNSVIKSNGSNSSVGILARNYYGSGSASFNINGYVSGRGTAIKITRDSNSDDITLTTGSSSYIEGLYQAGINIINYGSGTTTLTIGGDLKSSYGGYAMQIKSPNSTVSITLQDNADVYAFASTAIKVDSSTKVDLTLDGSSSTIVVEGGYDGVYSAIELGSQNDTVSINDNVTIIGDVNAGAGSDTLNLSGVTLNTPDSFNNFETVNITGINTITDALKIESDSALILDLASTSSISATNSAAKGLNTTSTSSGSTTLTIDGDINSNRFGLLVHTSTTSGDTSITTGASSLIDVSGLGAQSSSIGMYVDTYGVGATTLEISGDIKANQTGIHSNEYIGPSVTNNKSLSITTESTSSINVQTATSSSTSIGINAVNYYGTGSAYLELNGSINANQTGVRIDRYASTTVNLSIAVGSTGYIYGSSNAAIDATSNGSGTTDLTIEGEVTSFYGYGIKVSAPNSTTAITLQNGANVHTYNGEGKAAIKSDSATALTLTLNGDTSAVSLTGGSGSAVEFGIQADRMIISNDVTITGDIDAGLGNDILDLSGANLTTSNSFNNFETVNITGSNSLSSTLILESSSALALNLNGSSSTVSIAGSGATAILLASTDDTVTLSGNVEITGDIDAGAGMDILTFSDADVTLTYGTFTNFETVEIAGTNTLTGNFDLSELGLEIIQEGVSTLTINGTLFTDMIIVPSGVTIGGNNTLDANVIVKAGGVISPGNSVGTIVTTSDTTFNSGSSLNIEIDTSGVDLLDVAEVATINPGTTLNLTSLEPISGSGVLLSAGTISGSFDSIISSGPNIFTIFSPDENTISLASLNTDTLNSHIQSSLNSSILFNDTLNDQIADGAFTKGRNFWVRNVNRESSTNQPNQEFRNKSNGVALGAQMDVSDFYKIGFSLSQLHNSSKAKDNSGTRSDESTFASIYAIYNRDISENVKLFTSLSLGFGYHDNDNSRGVYNSGVLSYANSDSTDHEYSATLQLGSKMKLRNNYFLMPRVSATYINSFAGGFTESSGGDSAIMVNDHSFSTLKTRESVRFGKDSAINMNLLNNRVSLTPYVEVGFAQERAMGSRQIDGHFTVNQDRFTTDLEKSDRSFTTSALGVTAQINDDVSAFVSYENSSSSDENRNEVKGGIRIKF